MTAHFHRIEAVYRLDLPRREKALLLYLVHRVNLKTHKTDPSLATIAKDTGMSRRSILAARNGLRRKGYLTWTRRLINSTHNDTTEYQITWPTLWPKGHKGVVSERHQSTTTRRKQGMCIECGKYPGDYSGRCRSCFQLVESQDHVARVMLPN